MKRSRTIGKEWEERAVQYLIAQGYTILERNYRFQQTEIDIVACDGDEIVFVEVKYRASSKYGNPEDAVTEEKAERLQRAAEGYYFEHDLEKKPCRFDVIGFEGGHSTPVVRHMKNVLFHF